MALNPKQKWKKEEINGGTKIKRNQMKPSLKEELT